jgi:hypothetical protein
MIRARVRTRALPCLDAVDTEGMQQAHKGSCAVVQVSDASAPSAECVAPGQGMSKRAPAIAPELASRSEPGGASEVAGWPLSGCFEA